MVEDSRYATCVQSLLTFQPEKQSQSDSGRRCRWFESSYRDQFPFNCANEEAAGLRADVKVSELPH